MKTTPRSEKGGAPLEPFTTKLARQIVGDVIARIDERRALVPTKTKKKTSEDEIDDLVDDLDELDDEDEDEDTEVEDEDEDDDTEVEDEDEDDDEDEDEDDEEDPDEAPKKSSRAKSKAAAKKEKSGIGTRELADFLGTEPRSLRMYLRSAGIQPRDDREGRYSWPSMKDKEVQRIIKAVQKGAIEKENKAKLAALKERKAAKSSPAKKSTAKKSTARKRAAK